MRNNKTKEYVYLIIVFLVALFISFKEAPFFFAVLIIGIAYHAYVFRDNSKLAFDLVVIAALSIAQSLYLM